ncbi:MAG: hypothetical protein WD739_09450 [Actinomycetota bacterium]
MPSTRQSSTRQGGSKPAPKKRREAEPKWHARFLEVFRDTGNVRLAAQEAGVNRTTVYFARNNDREFRITMDEARDDAVDLLEAEAWRRATKGGSDTMLTFLLKANNPEKYRERHAFEHSGPGGAPIKVETEDPVAKLKAEVDELAKRRARKAG